MRGDAGGSLPAGASEWLSRSPSGCVAAVDYVADSVCYSAAAVWYSEPSVVGCEYDSEVGSSEPSVAVVEGPECGYVSGQVAAGCGLVISDCGVLEGSDEGSADALSDSS